MATDLVLYTVTDVDSTPAPAATGRVALITVNDPDRRNAVTDAMSVQLRAAVERAEADDSVHAVVITGAGKAFCAGADLSALGAAAQEGLLRIYDGFMAVGNCTLPTVAAVNGAAVGAGLNLALAADIRIAGPHAMFDPRFQKLGIHPGGGASWMLQRGVGPQVARAALLFGMRFDADAAVAHGLALTKADNAVAAAMQLAAGPAAAPREVVLATKASMRATAAPGSVDTDLHHAAMRIELGPQAASIQSPEFQLRLQAAQRR
jgi:enoyl-CoA hydratase